MQTSTSSLHSNYGKAHEGEPDPATVPARGELVVNTRHEFLAYGMHASACRVRVYTRGEAIIVVISETSEGTSFTNAIEQIASELLPDLVSANPTRRDAITWIEHWPANPRLLQGTSLAYESFDRVTFTHFIQPNARIHTREKLGSFRGARWRRIQREELESLIGMAWE